MVILKAYNGNYYTEKNRRVHSSKIMCDR